MGLTTEGLNYIGYMLCAGKWLALGQTSTTLLPYEKNYEDVQIIWSNNSQTDVTDKAYMYVEGGVVKNYNKFYFNDADDETGETQTGWGTVHYLHIVQHLLDDNDNLIRTSLYAGEINAPNGVAIPQDTRPKFEAAGTNAGIQITLTAAE